ncbi:alpha/beta-hydrolase [Trametes versicolor FP-101664 SS1]|uniref:Alpha/beta-hydrolase n=1 Tax=Trametes versicolor (strain FP-101664) TaxID=717944 RepID=R7S7M0_TRAVS|nr:alpha/beta-hydrolase [Trametes versicolor FP-101664 SS1]EIW52048.1 alpha/beta-hydrolase [Trametes versicolor FP-101664 SS1]
MGFLSYARVFTAAFVIGVFASRVSATAVPAETSLQTSRGEFTSQVVPDAKLRFVRNSGVCETTPGVEQLSGYLDVGTNMSMWFWFFEARHNPETAPFTLWLNGGPGCSSMIGLFQEHGPCQVEADGQTTVLNPFSWNNISNIIYIDQPIGTGFSFGTVDVNSTFAAAPAVWQAFQVLFESQQFAKFQSREFVFATESYGGHYGPEFVTFFDEQNAKIKNHTLKGELINVSALMINNGWYDPLLQNQAYVDFATDAPGYGPLQTPAVLAKLNQSYFEVGGCRDQELACYAAGEGPDSNDICGTADDFCVENVFFAAVGDRDSDDLRQNSSTPNPFPPEFYVKFLRNATILDKIGAQGRYAECSNPVGNQFSRTGDDARTLLPQLAALANSRLKMLIWAGDADINCNWLGGHASVLAMDWYGNETLHRTPLTNITIHGTPVAAVQNVDNFSFARVYQAGHEIPAFQPEAAFEIFSQVVHMEQLHSVP